MFDKQVHPKSRDLVNVLDQVRSVQREHRGCFKLIGDATVNILVYYLRRHLSRRARFVTRAWVEGCRNEFDLLIVKRNVKPMEFTNAYRKEDVRAIVEVKTSGSRDVLDKFSVQLGMFKQIGKQLGKRTVYISMLHTPKYARRVVKVFGKDAFILQMRTKTVKVRERDWQRLIRLVGSIM